MAMRKIVKIDEEKCDGCALCVPSCHEGAIQMVNGKDKLVSEVYCDGLGACLGECPQGAITIEERDASEFDEKAVETHLQKMKEPEKPASPPIACGCPGTAMKSFAPKKPVERNEGTSTPVSALQQWPVQLTLVPPQAPFLQNADILLCADCVPFAVPDFHSRYLAGRALLVGCPKLDDLDFYRKKLINILEAAKPKSVTVLRMEVPCCSGISFALLDARNQVAPKIPVEIHTIGIAGEIQKNKI